LRRLHKARGFSREKLARAIGGSQPMIAYYETHAAKAPAHHPHGNVIAHTDPCC
jgi:hypothetical protein